VPPILGMWQIVGGPGAGGTAAASAERSLLSRGDVITRIHRVLYRRSARGGQRCLFSQLPGQVRPAGHRGLHAAITTRTCSSRSGAAGRGLCQIAEAKAVCAYCPVRADCLGYALATGQDAGVWGGTTEDERRQIRSARPAPGCSAGHRGPTMARMGPTLAHCDLPRPDCARDFMERATGNRTRMTSRPAPPTARPPSQEARPRDLLDESMTGRCVRRGWAPMPVAG